MDESKSNSEILEDDDLEALLSLQTIEGQADEPLLQMFSTGSCVDFSCCW